jgi:hypothetical protein
VASWSALAFVHPIIPASGHRQLRCRRRRRLVPGDPLRSLIVDARDHAPPRRLYRGHADPGRCVGRCRRASGIEIDAVPLDPHVTRMAEADKVLGIVGVVGIREGDDGPDVVDIESTFGCGSASAAALVSQSYRSSCRPPTRPVVMGMSAAPCRILRPGTVGVAAIERTECRLALAFPPARWVLEDFAAVGACQRMKDSLSLGFPHRRDEGRFRLRGVAVG